MTFGFSLLAPSGVTRLFRARSTAEPTLRRKTHTYPCLAHRITPAGWTRAETYGCEAIAAENEAGRTAGSSAFPQVPSLCITEQDWSRFPETLVLATQLPLRFTHTTCREVAAAALRNLIVVTVLHHRNLHAADSAARKRQDRQDGKFSTPLHDLSPFGPGARTSHTGTMYKLCSKSPAENERTAERDWPIRKELTRRVHDQAPEWNTKKLAS